tara:strand:+ start:124 stop:372 length:249 start_codon:yes stop_codon:yes gene_type:complete
MEKRNHEMMETNNHHEHMDEDNKGKGMGLKHGLLMILCCLLPIMLIGALPLLGFENMSWSWAIFLLCPLMHVGMMFFMKDHH